MFCKQLPPKFVHVPNENLVKVAILDGVNYYLLNNYVKPNVGKSKKNNDKNEIILHLQWTIYTETSLSSQFTQIE